MTLIRNLKCFAAIALMTSLPLAGCGKDKKEGEAGKEGAATAESTQAAAGKYAQLPADSNFILGINVSQVRSSKLFKDMVEPIIAQQAGEDYEKVKASCGFDPAEQIKSIVIGGVAGKDDRVAVSITGMNAEQVEKCSKGLAEVQGEQIEVTHEGKLTKIIADGQTTWMGWMSDTTLVTTGPHKELVESLVAGKEGLSNNKPMLDLTGKVDTSAALWVVYNEQEGSPSPMAGAPVQVKAAHVSLSLAEGLTINATIRQSSPEEAQKTVADITGQLESLKESPYAKYVSKLELKASESEVIAKLTMSDAELQEMLNDPSVKMLGAMFGL